MVWLEMNCVAAGKSMITTHVRFSAWLAVFSCWMFFFSSFCFADQYKVIRVYSGDTIKVEDQNSIVKIRLVGIDAPETGEETEEPGQPLSEASRVYLSRMIFKKTVDIISYGYDIDNRILGIVQLDRKNINIEMIRAGMAEIYPGKAPPDFDLDPFRRAEKTARQDKKGIWSLGEEYISPRKWRAQHGQKTKFDDLPKLQVISPGTIEKKISTETGRSKDEIQSRPALGEKDAETVSVKKPAPKKTDPGGQRKTTTTVTGIDLEVGKNSEKIFVYLNGFSVPKAFDIDGENPRIVIDIWNVADWSGKSRIPGNGSLIKQIRTYLHKKDNKLRIVLDLNVNPSRDYSITQLYDIDKNTYWLEIK
jgi:endonuclease YncB( thermonuclease family)